MTEAADVGPRNWIAEAAEIEREYAEAKVALDVAFEAVRLGSPARSIETDSLLIFNEAKERFEAIKARRTAFLRERAAHEAANF